jgi:predicted TIM-barrel fold metal-dependent hydrolase
MRVVDGHLHVLDRAWVPTGMLRAWAQQAAAARYPPRSVDAIFKRTMVGQSDPTGDLTIGAFDRCGVSTGVIPVVDWTFVTPPEAADISIDGLHEHCDQLVARHPGRLFYCAGIDPRHPGATARMESARARPGCVGVKIYPAAGWQVDDPRYRWLFAAATESETPIVVHTSPLGGEPLITPYSRPAEMAPVIAAFPSLTIVFAHAGFEAWWLEACDIAAGWRHVHVDLSLWQPLAERDYAEFRRRVAVIVARIGAHRVIFGSDSIRGPRSDPDGSALERWIERVSALAEPFADDKPVLGNEELELVLAGNADRVYGLSHA